MQRTIQIGDKYKSLMKWYNEQYDKEEFNVFFTKLLVAYKKMKDKNIDLIIFSELIEKYDVDIYDLIRLLEENVNSKKIAKQNDNKSDIIKEKKEDNIVDLNTKEESKYNREYIEIKRPSNAAILTLGMDLSG